MRWDRIHRARRLVPVWAIPVLVRRRIDRIWADDAFRARNEAVMTHLLEFTERAAEAPDLARGFAEYTLARKYHRWHPVLIGNQPVRGVEWLTTGRDRSRPLILNFIHHHQYYGMFESLKNAGSPELHILVHKDVLGGEVHESMQQHMRMFARGGELVRTGEGLAGLLDLLRPDMVLAMAIDVPGHTEVDFLGRRVLGSSGAARAAVATGAPVVVVTSRRDGSGAAYLQVHPPLEPADFASPEALLAELLRIHGEAVLAWPEALDSPADRFGPVDA